ncbi:ATP-dependent DNA helicase RecG [Candidatus Epulonipiscium fishelsonii]|uniref:ATP-dependent DNA helicase RecG n=1 Tax=Candidatus Epulonipiscium fishelsonii TaxID=77094 RepID=A0ACC8XFP8_9FIRM|nr:ATP-dependent DNA helicase RecG [Epulopiscium sp. SCG-B11WGA-EpuloA1]
MTKGGEILVKGVGEQTLQRLNKLGIYTAIDLLEHYPREYEDRRIITSIDNINIDEKNNIIAVVTSIPYMSKTDKYIKVTFEASDNTGKINITFFGQSYLKNTFKVGESYNFYGKVEKIYKKLYMTSPDYKKVIPGNFEGQIIGIYPSTAKLTQAIIRKFIKIALNENLQSIKDILPQNLIKKHQLYSKQDAILNIHFPMNNEDFFKARNRLVFEELFMLQLTLNMAKENFNHKNEGFSKQIPNNLNEFMDCLPFSLTNAQNRVVNEILEDMQSENAGNRLVQGDVGSGKTVVAGIALFVAVQNGFQGALMAPTEVLATQHYKFFTELFKNFNINVAILTGSTTKKYKNIIMQELLNGDIDVIIGTHALIEEYVEIPQLGLVITDEQHRFGVRQRLTLTQKGTLPDVIVMTATPIPRTLALILYGDMDISIIDELPQGRLAIKTNFVNSGYYERIYAFIKKHIAEGRQCYIICPMVEESEKQSELKNVIEYSRELQSEHFKTERVAYLHGKMRPAEKNDIMSKFSAGEIDILVSTTVVEVGVNVPNATIMLIENAERFGLAQLHQLRGRVGRGNHQSFCILLSDTKSKDTQKRLKIMEQTTDGFVIADTDLQLRGGGDFFGTVQHGLPQMKIANLYTDTSLLKQIQQEVKSIIKDDPNFEKEEYSKVYKQVRQNVLDKNYYNAL